MRILFLTPYLPHPRSGHGSGDHIFGLVRYFSQAHSVTVLSFADGNELAQAQELRSLPLTLHVVPRSRGTQTTTFGNVRLALLRLSQLLRSIILWQPYYVSKYFDPAMANLIRRETERMPFDIVQIEFTFMGQYASYVRSGKTVLRAHDLAFRPSYRKAKAAGGGLTKWISIIEWCRWARYEPAIARRQDHVFLVTEQDRVLLARLSGGKNASYAAMGLDVPETVPPYEDRDRDVLLFVGSLGHEPNVEAALWLCRDIFPLVQSECPEARLRIIGRGAPPMLRTAAAANPSIEMMGFVEDLDRLLRSASLFVAPILSGGGIKTKIVHAMSYGLPVVTTPVGAEGIEDVSSSGLQIGRTAAELAGGIIELLRDRPKAASCALRGRELVLRHYTWKETGGRQASVYESLLNKHDS